MAIIGSASVQIRAVDKFFERDVRSAVKKIKNVGIELKADVNLTKVNKKLADLRYRMRNNVIQLNIDAQTEVIQKDFQKIVDTFDGKSISLQANADTLRAETQLALAARDRQTTLHARLNPNISPEAQKALQGLFYTLTGSIPFDKVKAGLLGLAGNFELITIKSAAVISVISALSASLFSLAGSAFTLGSDLADLVGIAAALPAGFFMLGTAITASTIAWKGFGDAVGGDEKALAKLPVEAREAAQALKGLGTEISTPVKEAFWVALEGSLQNLARTAVPSLTTGLTGAAKAMGILTREGFVSIENFIKTGGLDTMFTNSNIGLENMKRGIDPVVTAMGRLGTIGSKFLPKFGDWLSDIGEKFGNFINQASEDTITGWINDAISSIQNLGSSVKSTVDIFSSISEAASRAGFGGLRAFADGLERAAKVANSEPFKSQLTTIFKAAGDATGILTSSVGNLLKVFGRGSSVFGAFFREGSGAIAAFVDNVSFTLENSSMLSGLFTGLSDFKSALQDMQPGFKSLGGVIGNLGIIAGTVFKAMAPGFNQIMDTIDQVISSLTPGLEAVVPVFNEFVQSVISIASGPITALADGVGKFLQFFSQLPGPIQTVVLGLAAMVLLRPKLEGLFSGMANSFATARSRMDGDIAGLSGSTARMYGHFGRMNTHLRNAGDAMRLMPFAAVTSGLGGISTVAGNAAASVGKSAGAGLRGALSGGAALLGGPWGIALAGGIALISAFGQAQEESKGRVDALSKTLDQQSGAVTNATKSMLATNALDGATNDWDDFVRGVFQGSASIEELLGRLGISTKEYTDKLADPVGRDAFIKGFQDISDALLVGKPITDEMAKAIGKTKEELKGITSDEFDYLADKAGNAARELTDAEKTVKSIAEATGLTSAAATVFAKNLETLGSATSSASDKFTALKSNLDIVTGGMQSSANARKAYEQSIDDTTTALTELTKGGEVSLNSLYAVGAGFDFAQQSGRDLHSTLTTATDAILKNGTTALDQAIKGGKSAADANSIAIQAMQPGVNALKSQLASLGIEQPKIDEIIRSFGLMPDQIATAVTVEGTEEAQRKIFLTKLAADAFANGNYRAVLGALPDAAKIAIEGATGLAGAFAAGNYDAILEALDKTGPGKEAALAQILSVTNGNYDAAIKATDFTKGATDSAKGNIGGVDGKSVDIRAVDKASGPAREARSAIDLVRDKTVTILSLFRTSGTPGAPTTPDRGPGPWAANGAVIKSVRNQSSLLSGKFPMQFKAFADGGVEKHVAQIAKAGTMRLWAEPETGGEAYIPLAKSKRSQSLKILEEVARIFGFGLHNMNFENGGVVQTQMAPAISSDSGLPPVNFNVYPSAGLNEQQIGESALNEFYWKLTNN